MKNSDTGKNKNISHDVKIERNALKKNLKLSAALKKNLLRRKDKAEK